ncbi:MAG TPA: hypothetical protein VHF06_27705, partial [Pseudonocardiaceae bacterium]|nr:hypothetical protein [Pseudonocardiaceae bacterium]
MSDEDDKYRLPAPDLSAFGSDEPGGDGPDESPAEPAGSGGPHGTMRFQDRETTSPRPPTLAEQRARMQAENALAEQRAAAEARALQRRRVMIGGGVTVGVVAVVGAWYLLASPKTVTAQCTVASGAQTDTIVNDQYCDESYVTSHGGHISNGFIFLPLPGGGYQQYHYYYGG